MSQPDNPSSMPLWEQIALMHSESSIDRQVDSVIQMYFNHPVLHGYSRIREFPEYYNPTTERFESLLVGHIGDIQWPGEIAISSRSKAIQIIQPFREMDDIVRWEGLTLSKMKEGDFKAEMVNRYYVHPKHGEVQLIPNSIIRFPLRPEQVLDEARNVYGTFRIRYNSAR